MSRPKTSIVILPKSHTNLPIFLDRALFQKGWWPLSNCLDLSFLIVAKRIFSAKEGKKDWP